MVSKDAALPGRKEPMRVSPTHYVLQTPMHGPFSPELKVCIFANGCFWGSEKGAWRLPGGGIHTTAVGYAAGYTPNPTYDEVCSGRTGHTEAVQAVFDPTKISLVDVLRWFWESHDPTQGMGQGNDRGTQYRSGLYYVDEEQRMLMEASKAAYEKALGQKITTEIAAASDYPQCFYYAEDYHRAHRSNSTARLAVSVDGVASFISSPAEQYLAKPGARPYCSAQPRQVSLPP